MGRFSGRSFEENWWDHRTRMHLLAASAALCVLTLKLRAMGLGRSQAHEA